jgi:hypothetical protein
MPRLSRRIAVACLSSFVVVSLVAGSAPAGAKLSDARRADRAVGFLADAQRRNGSIPAFSRIGSTADAVLAFVAAGSGRREARRALAFLASRAEAGRVATEGSKAKVVLAFASAGRPARRIGGQRFVRELRLGYADGLEHTVFDTALAVLAIRAAGAAVPDGAVQLLVDEQCPDGGWAFDRFDQGGEDEHCFSGDAGSDFFLSDTNTTAATSRPWRSIWPIRAGVTDRRSKNEA